MGLKVKEVEGAVTPADSGPGGGAGDYSGSSAHLPSTSSVNKWSGTGEKFGEIVAAGGVEELPANQWNLKTPPSLPALNRAANHPEVKRTGRPHRARAPGPTRVGVISGPAARNAGQGVLLLLLVYQCSDRGGVCWREHHTASPTAAAHAKTLGQQSHNPLVRVTDEGRGLQSVLEQHQFRVERAPPSHFEISPGDRKWFDDTRRCEEEVPGGWEEQECESPANPAVHADSGQGKKQRESRRECVSVCVRGEECAEECEMPAGPNMTETEDGGNEKEEMETLRTPEK
ncbi:unnamed protein product [Pleuronectes platessa]|uniref:Uncharacterized protein n=1 Tax=Pleuronectes platessa TaxID=8262 RepID=A0A9N7UQH8_PLEPL|nr:unnamed protein product [Pleuronectes platessa]